MNFADIQWIYILTSFLIGGVIGALLYRLMNAGGANNSKVRRQLTEREQELSQVRENLNDHFSRTAINLSSLTKQLQSMEEQLASDANLLCSDESLVKRLATQSPDQLQLDNPALDNPKVNDPKISNQQPPKDYALDKDRGTLSENFQQNRFEPPRDYAADKTGGTLAEDFGLKPEVFEPTQKKS